MDGIEKDGCVDNNSDVCGSTNKQVVFDRSETDDGELVIPASCGLCMDIAY